MSNETAQFVFMTCRAGAENALKHEVARTDPTWRPAFSRPGFLTFKLPTEAAANEPQLAGRQLAALQLAERHWTFAHAHGISLGRLTGSQLSELVEQLWQMEGVRALCAGEASLVDVHVWQRTPASGDEHALQSSVTPLCREVEAAIRAAAPADCDKLRRAPAARRRAAPRGGCVLDIVVIEPGEWCVGFHRVVTVPQRWPGGMSPVKMPEHAASRAYAKMNEALYWSGMPIAAGDECVEIGCAPGGACQALLDCGLFVTGIDPADVDPILLEHPQFRHLKKRGEDVRRREFVGVRWLAADMNIPPDATLDEVEAIVTRSGVSIRGLILTLKLSDWSLAERLPGFVERVRGWGYRDVRTRQLVTGGQEVCLVALRRKALRRIGRPARGRKLSGKRPDAPHPAPPSPHF